MANHRVRREVTTIKAPQIHGTSAAGEKSPVGVRAAAIEIQLKVESCPSVFRVPEHMLGDAV